VYGAWAAGRESEEGEGEQKKRRECERCGDLSNEGVCNRGTREYWMNKKRRKRSGQRWPNR